MINVSKRSPDDKKTSSGLQSLQATSQISTINPDKNTPKNYKTMINKNTALLALDPRLPLTTL